MTLSSPDVAAVFPIHLRRTCRRGSGPPISRSGRLGPTTPARHRLRPSKEISLKYSLMSAYGSTIAVSRRGITVYQNVPPPEVARNDITAKEDKLPTTVRSGDES